MPRLEFVTGSTRDGDFRAATTERMVNTFAEPLAEGALARYQIKSVLGQDAFSSLPGVFVRAMAQIPAADLTERLFTLNDGRLYQIAANGLKTDIGAIDDGVTASISGNGGDVTVVSNGKYYLWDGSTLTQPTAGAFSDFGSVEFLGGYTILTERGGRKIQWSALANPASLPGLNFATAEGRDDEIIRAVAVAGNLWVFKATSIEIWTTTQQANENAFAQIPGTMIENGLRGFGLVTKIPSGVFFVGTDGKAFVGGGAQISPVSTPAVETAIEQGEPSHCFFYEDEGHAFCVIRFADRPAWVYDLSTRLWHERATGEGRWVATHSAKFSGAWRVAGDGGAVSTLARSNMDAGAPLIRRVVSRTLYLESNRFRVPKLEILGRMGRSDIGREAMAMVRVSRDGGLTFGTERRVSMGALGQYDRRAVLRNLGQARQMVVEVTITDPADLTLLSSAVVEVA